MTKYIDLNLAFIKHPNTRDIVKRYDVDAVKTAVRNMIRTNLGEKMFKPNFGGDLRALLFDPMTTANPSVLKRKWNEMMKMYEPRATIDDLQIKSENAELYILLELSLVETPDIKFTLPLSVQRVR